MHWPQYTWLAIVFLGLGLKMANQGKPMEGKHSVWAYLGSCVFTAFILYKGGFFTGGN